MKYTNDAGQTFNLDKKFMTEVDQEEGRERYPNCVVNAIVALTGAWSLLMENADKVKLTSTRHKDNAWKMYKMAMGLIHAANARLCTKMSMRQNLACIENTKDLCISISVKPNTRSVNVLQTDLDALCAGCLANCKNCLKTEQEARDCETRKALDTMSNINGDETGFLMCSYMDAEVIKWRD